MFSYILSHLLLINPIIPIAAGIFIYFDSRKLKRKGAPVNPAMTTTLVLVSSYLLLLVIPPALGVEIGYVSSPSFLVELLAYLIPISVYFLIRRSKYKTTELEPVPIQNHDKKLKWSSVILIPIILFYGAFCAVSSFGNKTPVICELETAIEKLFGFY